MITWISQTAYTLIHVCDGKPAQHDVTRSQFNIRIWSLIKGNFSDASKRATPRAVNDPRQQAWLARLDVHFDQSYMYIIIKGLCPNAGLEEDIV